MRKIFPAEELARDARFIRQTNEQRLGDPRGARVAGGSSGDRLAKLTPELANGPDRARALMHGIFVGEIQALEGAGRTCWDFELDDRRAQNDGYDILYLFLLIWGRFELIFGGQ